MSLSRRRLGGVRSVVALILLVTGSVGSASAGNLDGLLRGEYAFSGSATCLVSRGGFNQDLTPVGPPAPFPHIVSFAIQGTRTFNGDGTGSATARVVNISHPFALPTTPTPVFNRGGASASDIVSTFTYEVAPDRTFTLETRTLTGTVVAGPEAGQTFSVTNLPRFSGLISRDHRTLSVNHDEPGVETITFSDGDIQHRVCLRARILLEKKGS